MRLNVVRSAHAASLYVVKSAWVNGKRTTKVVEKLGTEADLRKKLDGRDPYEWAKEYIDELNRKSDAEKVKITISYSPSEQIKKDERRSYNAGYLFLQKTYYDLGLNKICTAIKRKHAFKYDLNSILSRLIFTRIIYPGSKKSAFEDSGRFIERPNFELHQVYRALSVLSEETDYIQSQIYKNSLQLSKRNTGVIYYDCTNFYFEIEQSDEGDGLRQYGVSKENRPNPIVQMGLFMDGDGIPLAFCINPGNTNEQITLTPLEKKLLADFSLSGFVVCTDAGLSSHDNRRFNDRCGRAFITVQSVKTLKEFQKNWCLERNGWKKYGDRSGRTYSIDDLDEEKDYETVLYRERWFNENDLEQRMIVTYSLKYRDYLKALRERHVERAKRKVNHPSELKRKRGTDAKRFIKENRCTDDGEIAENTVFSIDEDRIAEESGYDGFYAVCTNLEDDARQIVKINQSRWEIEECFRIIKHEFRARPAYLSRSERIKAHFMTCFIALIVYRYLEKQVGEDYTAEKIIQTLRDMNMVKQDGYGYIPAFDRTDLTDRLQEVTDICTSTEIVTMANMRSVCKLSKTPAAGQKAEEDT